MTLNWYASGDGCTRMDGKQDIVDAIRPRMQQAFEEYIQGQPEHARYTGRNADSAPVQQARRQAVDVGRMAQENRIRGQVLTLQRGAQIFCPDRTQGLWDVLEQGVGTRTTPSYNTTPWSFLLRTGLVVSARPDGVVKVTSARNEVEDIDREGRAVHY